MNINILGATTAVALAITAVPALAATVTFDSFDEAQAVSAVSADQSNDETISFGGTTANRTFTVTTEVEEGVNPIDATSLEAFEGTLSFNNDAGAKGTGVLDYDFDGSVDLLAGLGLNPYFDFNVISFDGAVDFTASGVDSAGKKISYFETITDEGFDSNLYFSQFEGSDVFNFGEVASLQFALSSIDTSISIDGRLASIELSDVAPIPLPASGLLLLAGMGGMSLLRRRRKA